MNKIYLFIIFIFLLLYLYNKHNIVIYKLYTKLIKWSQIKYINNFQNFNLELPEINYLDDEVNIISKTLIDDLLEPIMYYKNLPGKNIRKIITSYIGNKFKVDNQLIVFTYNFIDDLHNASLVIDDIQDNSLIRRNSKTCHLKYGIPMSIGAASLYIFKKLKEYNYKVLDIIDYDILKNKEEYKYLDDKIVKMHIHYILSNKILNMIYLMNLGQQMDVFWTYKKKIPSINDYYYMIENKTGKLFTIIIEIFYELTNNITKKEYELYNLLLNKLALYFQIRDDYINITDPSYWKIKGFCEDFDEKKYSFIIIQFYNDKNISIKNKKKFFKLFYKKNLSNLQKYNLLKIINKTNIFKNTYYILIKLQDEIKELNIDLNILNVSKFYLKDAKIYL